MNSHFAWHLFMYIYIHLFWYIFVSCFILHIFGKLSWSWPHKMYIYMYPIFGSMLLIPGGRCHDWSWSAPVACGGWTPSGGDHRHAGGPGGKMVGKWSDNGMFLSMRCWKMVGTWDVMSCFFSETIPLRNYFRVPFLCQGFDS